MLKSTVYGFTTKFQQNTLSVNTIRNKSADAIIANQPKDKTAELKKAQQTFFKLLTAQLKYQDLDNPVDTNQITQNIYQMNELQTLMSMDSKLDDMKDMMQRSVSLQSASNMIGKYAISRNNHFTVENPGEMIPINYVFNSDMDKAENVIVKVFDMSGKIVHESHLKDITTNTMQMFEWQHNVPGTYRVSIGSLNDGGDYKTADIYTSTKIQQIFADGGFITSTGQKLSVPDILAIQDVIKPMIAATDSMIHRASKHGRVKQSISDLFANI